MRRATGSPMGRPMKGLEVNLNGVLREDMRAAQHRTKTLSRRAKGARHVDICWLQSASRCPLGDFGDYMQLGCEARRNGKLRIYLG